jgi:hypothetical protein
VTKKFTDCFSTLIKVLYHFVPLLVDALLLEVNYTTKLLDYIIVPSILDADLVHAHHLNSTEKTIFGGEEMFLPHILQIPSERLAF